MLNLIYIRHDLFIYDYEYVTSNINFASYNKNFKWKQIGMVTQIMRPVIYCAATVLACGINKLHCKLNISIIT